MAKLQPEYFRTDLLMSTYWRTLLATIGLLAFVLTILAAPSAHAVLDFKEVMAISSAIEGIYIEGQDGFYLPPGTDGQLLAETYPSDLQKRVRWDIVGQDDDLVIALNADTGLLSVDETSGLGWITVQAAADGCAPRTKRIEIGCGCAGESGTCDTTAGAGAVVNGSVDVRMSLGQGDRGRPVGSLILSAKEPLAILSTPEALEIDSAGNEVDVVLEKDGNLIPVEIKSSAKNRNSDLNNLKWFQRWYRICLGKCPNIKNPARFTRRVLGIPKSGNSF